MSSGRASPMQKSQSVHMDVTVDCEMIEGCLVKIGAESWEINIHASADELLALRDIRSAAWESRASISAGRSAGGRVWWCSEGGSARVLIGDDDETWDMAVTIPLAVVDEIVARAGRHGPDA